MPDPPSLSLLQHPLDRGDHIATARNLHRVAHPQLEHRDVVLVVQRDVADHGAGELHRPQAGHRGDASAAPDLYVDRLHHRLRLRGLELVGHRPAGVVAGVPQLLARLEGVDLRHEAVDLIGEGGPLRRLFLDERGEVGKTSAGARHIGRLQL